MNEDEPGGSSPLTRGKPPAQRTERRQIGLIPAHAGKTPLHREDASLRAAHPRSRGENAAPGKQAIGVAGSSPLTRGKRGWRRKGQHVRGLIPAHAGKTPRAQPPPRAATAHPRSRGENRVDIFYTTSMPGSSPLTRGKLLRCRRRPFGRRLIPAHAGKTPRRRGHCQHGRAHPRSRGENLVDSLCGVLRAGSSPLTRGKRRRVTE